MPKNKKSVSPAQIKGSCGHVKGAWDSHKSCISCTKCSRDNPCETCSYWPTESWIKASKRRTYASRNTNKQARPVTEGEKPPMEKEVSQEMSERQSPNPAKLSVALDGKHFQKAAALESPVSSAVSITAGTVGRGASLSKHEEQPQERTVNSLPGHKDAVQHNLSPLGSNRSCFSQQTEADKIRFREVISDKVQLSDMHPMSDRDQKSDRYLMSDIVQMSDRNQLSDRYLMSDRHPESDRHLMLEGELIARPITTDQAIISRRSISAPNRYRSESGFITGHRSPPRHRSPVKYRSPVYDRSIIDHRSISGYRSPAKEYRSPVTVYRAPDNGHRPPFNGQQAPVTGH